MTLQKHARGEGFPPHPEDEPEPRPPWPEGYLRGLDLFNAGRFWECHEALEEIWLPLSAGPKLFYQAIIQTAAAFHHVTRTRSWAGAAKLFEEARKKLARYAGDRERYGGLDVRWLLARLERCRDEAEAVLRGEKREFDRALFFTLRPEE